MTSAEDYDVIVCGGGPAGSAMAWALSRQGVRVAVVERSRFPREKVCGDFVEPGGLRILAAMQCLDAVEAGSPIPITHVRSYVESELAYREKIPYYEPRLGLPPHGYIVPRSELDTHLLECARSASANVYEGCTVDRVVREGSVVSVGARVDGKRLELRAPLVVGADGTESIVARSFGLERTDPRYICVSQRGYVEGVAVTGEAATWFYDDIFPGYAWMFPFKGGRANIGVGVLKEASKRYDLSVPKLFQGFIEKLRREHLGCADIRLTRRPLGGIVKSYAGITRNHFDGGLLVGDAGSFADPLTGEGITPGMESALIASDTLVAALEQGRFDAEFLSRFDRDFRGYFDPAMRYLQVIATLMRNRDLREYCLSAIARGFAEATRDPVFARVAGASFGGLELRPSAIMGQVWTKIGHYFAEGSAEVGLALLRGRPVPSGGLVDDVAAWQRGMTRSFLSDPRWHLSWLGDLARTSAQFMWTPRNPRLRGPDQLSRLGFSDTPPSAGDILSTGGGAS
jgi:geranylgeranyl reductase family protein